MTEHIISSITTLSDKDEVTDATAQSIRPRLIVVLGMHRSGTSAITRALKVLGVDLGDTLLPSQSDNEKGFWEDSDIYAFNEELLTTLNSSWHHLTPVGQDDLEKLHSAGYFSQAFELLRDKMQKKLIFGVKDPRIAKLLPFWKQVFTHGEFDVDFVIAVRNPLSVAKSLAKRNGFDHEKSYYLWLGHILTSLAVADSGRSVIIDYDKLMETPERELQRMADNLQLETIPGELEVYLSEFLDKRLQHNKYSIDDLQQDNACPKPVYTTYLTLMEMAADKIKIDDIRLQDQIQQWRTEFENLIPILTLTDKLFTKSEQFTSTYTTLNNLITTEKEIFDSETTKLNQKITEQESRLFNLTSETTELIQKINEQENRLFDLTKERDRYRDWALDLDRRLKEELLKISLIYSSSSWKITLPMREIKHWITNPALQTRRYLVEAINIGNAAYMRLPLTSQTKVAHRLFIAKHMPWLLRANRGLHAASPANPNRSIDELQITDKDAFADNIALNVSSQPIVSIIIPIYGKCDYTLRCLASIAAAQPTAAYEIIVVDDNSPDNSVQTLHRVNGIRLISNTENQGFIRSCNKGAEAAHGRYLYFLNNDTAVTNGWLDELLRTFNEFPGTGLTGSKLMYPDGTLQEAGGIIWQDGSAWNFGRNQNPDLPVYCYAREVDYCSGASIMIPTSLFQELGGFDEHYLPAYCEDSDLALKVRAKGYRVIYQPLSVVFHFEGITSGTDLNQGIKAYQVENLKKQYERWKDRLSHHQKNGTEIDRAKDRAAEKRVLVIDHCTPTPNQDAGSIYIYNIMLLMREMGYQVTFIPEDNFLYMPDYTSALQREGIEVLYAPYYTTVEYHLKEAGKRYDLAFLIRVGVVERHLKNIRRYCNQAKVVFHTVDLHYLRLTREAALFDDPEKLKAAEAVKTTELAAISSVDATTVVSSEELSQLQSLVPASKVFTLPFSLKIRSTEVSFKDRRDIVFVGGFQHLPNVDAVQYFVHSIMPLLRKKLPGVCFYIVGSKPPKEIQELAAGDIIVKGYVEDLEPLLDQIRINIAPLRYGAGIKGKVANAMTQGLPTVATSIANEGMPLIDGKHILVADSEEAFANAVVRLYEDELLWKQLSENGLEFAEHEWGGESAWNKLNAILTDLGLPSRRTSRLLTLYSPDIAP